MLWSWISKYHVPEEDKYDDRTWEAVIRDGYLASAVLLAIDFERQAERAASMDDTLTYLKAAYQASITAPDAHTDTGRQAYRHSYRHTHTQRDTRRRFPLPPNDCRCMMSCCNVKNQN